MKTQTNYNEIWPKFAQLVQHANVANCSFAATEIIRDTNRFIASRKDRMEAEQLVQNRSERLAELIMQLRNVDCGTPDEIRIKKQCLEILVEMKRLTELAPLTVLETAPLIPEIENAQSVAEPKQETELDREFRRLSSS